MTAPATAPRERTQPPVIIIGGGLAGLAAALRLAEEGLAVELFEARSVLGGRAASYRDPQTGELIDHCQHVGMACCTNFHDFAVRAGIADQFDRLDKLHFFGPDGTRYDMQAAWWLPAPLHLGPSLLAQAYLTWSERLGIARTLWRLARRPQREGASSPTIGAWLREQGQTEPAIERFWSVVLVSALGESLDRASLAAAQKVFVDGFLNHRGAYAVDVPRTSLRELFDVAVAAKLASLGVRIQRGASVRELLGDAHGCSSIRGEDGATRDVEDLILATPWRRVGELLSPELATALPELAPLASLAASPISGVHLWFDRDLTPLTHAVLVGRFTQWVFRRERHATAAPGHAQANAHASHTHYYQAVISASRDLSAMTAPAIIAAVRADLAAIFPAAREAVLVAHKIVTEREAVFSYRPGLDTLRPRQQTHVPNLFLAGDWTCTGWPSTMESAVRSGYLAAEAVLARRGRSRQLLAPDLPRSRLAEWLL